MTLFINSQENSNDQMEILKKKEDGLVFPLLSYVAVYFVIPQIPPIHSSVFRSPELKCLVN